MHAKFALKKLGPPEYFMGIEIKCLAFENLLLTWSKYVSDLLPKYNMSHANYITTPMHSTCELSKHGSSPLIYSFMCLSMVGALQYVTLTLPDIAFSVNKACHYVASPLDSYSISVKCILCYLSGTLDHEFLISPASFSYKLSLPVYKDFNWTSDLDDR